MRGPAPGLVAAALLLVLLLPAPAGALPAVGAEQRREDWTWTVVDARGLALGGGGLDAEDLRHLHGQGFRAVVNHRAEHPDDADALRRLGMAYLYLPGTYAESETMPLAHVHEAVAFLERNLREGKPVYVHCTGGWHRSAVGVAAFFMKENGWRAQQAWDHLARLRPGVEPRYMDVLLEYEAWLFGEPKLTLDLWTQRWDVAPGETVALHALATRDGVPVEGARVRWAFDHAEGQGEAVTDAQGRASFRATVPGGERARYVHATATLDGLVAGYDRNVYWVGESQGAPPTAMDVGAEVLRAEPGEEVRIPVALREGEKPTNARVTVTGPCGTLFRAYSGWDGEVDATFRAPERPGEYSLLVRATRVPAEPVEQEVRLVVGEGGGPPGCDGIPAESALRVPAPGLLAVAAARGLSARPWARRASARCACR